MAGLAPEVRLADQVALICWLRLRLFLNSLRGLQGKFEFVSKIILLVAGSGVAVGGAFGFFAAGLSLAQAGRERLLPLPLWGIFAAWFLLPIFIGAFRAEFEFRNLLRYPLRYSTFYALSLAYGLFDFTTVLSLVWLGGFAAGVIVARAALAPWVVLVLGVFAITLLTLNSVVYAWLERLLATRKARERFFVVMLLVLVGFQFIAPVGHRYQAALKPLFQAVVPVLDVLPPSLAGRALQQGATGSYAAGLALWGALIAFGAVFGWLLHRRLHEQYLGEDASSETQAPVAPPPKGARNVAGASALGSFLRLFLRDPIAALVEKEIRYVARHSMMLFNLFVPLVMVLFFSITFSRGSGVFGVFSTHSPYAYPACVGYALLIIAAPALNSFAYDGAGIQFLLVAPVELRDVLLAKNIYLGLLAVLQMTLLLPLVLWIYGPPPLGVLVATLLYAALALLVDCSAGNFFSTRFPRAFQYGTLRQKQSGITAVANLGVQLTLIALAVLIFGAAKLAGGSMWYAAAGFATLGGMVFPAYRWMLEVSARLASDSRETLIAELAKEPAR